uniref:Alpha/beta hydrolase fold protein n=1 Tax=Tanacetum cinerariifolium TaxID=118510 RepID=A0A6L2LIU4_TANCI|nr:alpha/beta hydrolase fold protein [Tanacetum cinerariifolium]
MMSHIAHVELPKLSFLGNTSNESEYEVGPAEKHRVPLVVPVFVAMALSALHLQLRYGEKSDGLVTCRDAKIPGSVVFLSQHKLLKGIPLISFCSEANVGPAVISMMSHIARVELPKISFLGNTSDESEEKSDGLVTCRDAEVPGSVVVHPNQKLDHAWMVYLSWNKNQAGADASEMCEALLTMLVELGKADNSGRLKDFRYKGDIKSLEDLTYEKRKQFLSQHKLLKGISLISFRSEAIVGPGVISMMSHIAYMELPKLSFLGNTSDESEYEVGPEEKHRVPLAVPVSIAMALSALHLQLHYGEKSDGLFVME